jgi:hypothetical protein
VNIDRDEVAATRERRTTLVTDLVTEMADAVDLLGDLSRDVTVEGGRTYRLTIERV